LELKSAPLCDQWCMKSNQYLKCLGKQFSKFKWPLYLQTRILSYNVTPDTKVPIVRLFQYYADTVVTLPQCYTAVSRYQDTVIALLQCYTAFMLLRCYTVIPTYQDTGHNTATKLLYVVITRSFTI